MTSKGVRNYTCRVCGAPGYAKGLCERDYARSRRGINLTPESLRATSVEQAFAMYCVFNLETECIEWQGSRDSSGYGTISISGKNVKAHREALRRSGVEVNGYLVLHSCDNPSCVNVDHLRVGTAQDNADDMTSRGRQARGWRNARRKLSDADVDAIRLSDAGAGALARTYGVSRQHIYKIRSGSQRPWRSVIGPVHPDDAPMAGAS